MRIEDNIRLVPEVPALCYADTHEDNFNILVFGEVNRITGNNHSIVQFQWRSRSINCEGPQSRGSLRGANGA